ncbi:hypothetical protein [Amycolatopsis suaedae]|uniref:Prenyltransferase n=1 Tax=Amycolatopsis suaedae TaxID=2510978 RepID=A0A4Q7J7R8_9PSEU|nr:hypothetical protein [Amycolatopsis suaedae]RZQ62978.1 hypothetical protein EWH70_14880 [Amycolatopsis suaedae]
MSTLTDTRRFLSTHARLLERRLAGLLLDDGGPAEAGAVLDVLAGYRNPDGGLGHALEPDVRAPDSQPLAVDFALEVVDQILDSPAGTGVRERAREFAAGLVPYLESVTTADGGLPIVLPSVTRYPRADHWGDGVFGAGLNPTAGILARLRRLEVGGPWLERAGKFCRAEADRALDGELDAHTALNVLRFLESDGDTAGVERLSERIGELTLFHLYPGPGYGLTPLDFAPHPDDPRRRLFPADAVDAHLDVLAAAREDDGGWPVPWTPPGPAALAEWRGVVTLRAAVVLRANARG